MIKLAYIGNGKSTNRYHLPFVMTLAHLFEVKTIYSRNPSISWPNYEKIHYTHNLDDILLDASIDAVVITSPSNTHYDYALKVLQSGKHCFVEKPFALTSLEASELFELANQRKLIIMPYQNRRFDADLHSLKNILESGDLGKLFEVNLSFDTDRSDTITKDICGSKDNSYLYGIGTHSLDQALSTFGKPLSYYGHAQSLMGPNTMNDYYAIHLVYDGFMVNVEGSMHRIKSRPAIEAYGTEGIFIKESRDIQEEYLKSNIMPSHPSFGIEPNERYGKLILRNQTKTLPTPKTSYSMMYELFYDVIKENKTFDTSIIVLQLEILESIYNTLH